MIERSIGVFYGKQRNPFPTYRGLYSEYNEAAHPMPSTCSSACCPSVVNKQYVLTPTVSRVGYSLRTAVLREATPPAPFTDSLTSM